MCSDVVDDMKNAFAGKEHFIPIFKCLFNTMTSINVINTNYKYGFHIDIIAIRFFYHNTTENPN